MVQEEVRLVSWFGVLAKSRWIQPQRIRPEFKTESRTNSTDRRLRARFKKRVQKTKKRKRRKR